MRRHILWGCALLALSVARPAMLRAQFQNPTGDELKMTSDPKVPGAAAVYLDREEIADDEQHFRSYYERIKILTEKGKELATVRIPYERGQFKGASIIGRTIHSDGTVIVLSVKPEDLVDPASKYDQQNTIVFTLPSVQVGSILEYRLELRYDEDTVFLPRWEIQEPYFVHKAHYSFHPGRVAVTDSYGVPLDTLVWTSTSKLINVQHVKGRYILDLTDIPPIPNEDWMPPLNTINWNVRFYYTNSQNNEQFWQSEGARWASEIAEFIRPSQALKSAAASLVSSGDSDEVKMRKLYAAVMKLDNTDFSRVKPDDKHEQQKLASADDIWKQQSGSSNEIALIYAAMVQAVGLQAWPMKVVNRIRATFDAGYMSLDQLDDVIVVVAMNGKDIYLDPGEKMCPFGSLHWEHTLAGGLRSSANGAAVAVTPAAAYKENEIERSADLTLDERGKVSGDARYLMTGTEALYWRQLALRNDETEVKKQFVEAIRSDLPEGVDARVKYFVGLTDDESNLTSVVDLSGSLGAPAASHLIVPGLFFESGVKHPFVSEEKRTTPIDFHYPEQEEDQVTYELPEGFSVESLPKNSDVNWPDNAQLQITSGTTDGFVEVARVFARNVVLLAPGDYASLHDFYEKLAAADQQQIVLTRPAAALGN